MTRLFRSNSKAWNDRAGANTHSRDVRGQHTPNAGFKPGENWVECQRCGMDIRAQHAREDGYQEGLIVCPTCYDPPHPQDYVHAFDDEIAPDGLSTGVAEYDRTGAEGSTEVPGPTDTIGDDPLGLIPDEISLAPDELTSGVICGWYDFSVLDDSYADAGGVTNVVDGGDVLRQNSKNGTGANFPNNFLVPDSVANEAPWNANRQNGLGAWLPHPGVPQNAGDLSASNPFAGPSLPMTIVGVMKIPAGTGVDRYWFGSEVSNGQNGGLSQNAEGNAPQLETQRTTPTPAQTITTGSSSWSAYANDWQMWLVQYETGVGSTIEINNQAMVGGAISHDHLDLPFNGLAIGNQNINTSTFPYYGWSTDIGEVIVFCSILTDSDKAALFNYMKAKWQLSTYP